jgi:hypothetical protein
VAQAALQCRAGGVREELAVQWLMANGYGRIATTSFPTA